MTALKTFIFTLLIPGTVAVLGPYLLLTSSSAAFPPAAGSMRWLGVVPLLLGSMIYLWCAADFVLAGRGTPAPINPPKELVVRGLYQHVRNPMYVGVILWLIGVTLIFAALPLLVYTLFVWVGFHLFVQQYEEPSLRRRFGATYERYCQVVPRWVPHLRPHR